ncbi:MAG: flagellar protein FlaB, partial [Desulfobacteraceae bacterium]|nr:flagellar protein FlaB [Desulfobacteraceae bacterium]
STVGGSVDIDKNIAITDDFTIAANSTIATDSVLTDGSSIGGIVTLANEETVDEDTDLLMKGGSTLAEGSVIAENTYLTDDVTAFDGTVYTAGTILQDSITTKGETAIANDMTLQNGSVLAKGSTLAANDQDTKFADAVTGEGQISRLSNLKVLTQEDAQTAISIADSALKALDKNRANLGSIQNQLVSTISNVSTTKVNVQAAESTIRDVDFAEESANFTKMQILQQAGTFAMSQANASAQQVLSLLQQ